MSHGNKRWLIVVVDVSHGSHNDCIASCGPFFDPPLLPKQLGVVLHSLFVVGGQDIERIFYCEPRCSKSFLVLQGLVS